MPVAWFVLDSLHADYAAVLSALDTATANKYTISPTQVVRDASHDTDYKLVSANLDDDERVGALAPLSRDKYGDGVYKDEYSTQDHKEIEGFNLLGESGRATLHYDQPYTPDGDWTWSSPALPDSTGDGRTYGDRIIGYPTFNGPFSTVTEPTSLTDCYFHGFHIAVWLGTGSGRTVGAFASMQCYNGAASDNKLTNRFDHPIKPGAMSEGVVLQHEHSWLKDSGSNAYSIIEGSSAHSSLTAASSIFHDPDYDRLEFGGEIIPVADEGVVKATPGTHFYDSGTDKWWVHMPDGSDPTGRIVGTGNFGFRWAWTDQPNAEEVRENIAFHGLKYRCGTISFRASNSGVKTIQNIDFHMLNMRYVSGSNTNRLFTLFGQDRGAATTIQDILINVDQISRGSNGIYIVNQDGTKESSLIQRVTVQGDPNARDGRENIFDIGGAVPWEVSSDGHAVAPQMSNDMIIQHLKTRRCGGHIVGYFRNWLADGMNSTNRPVDNILFANLDCAEHSEFFVTGGSNAVLIAVNSDNNLVYPALNITVRDNVLRGYDTIPDRAATYCLRNIIPDQVSLLGNDCDLAAVAQIDMGKNIAHKWITLTGSSGNWSLDDFIEDNATPGTKIGRIVKIESSNPTVVLHYCHPTNQTATAQDILTGVTINNMDDTGTGTTDGANSSQSLGPNTIIGESATNRTTLGNSGATASWIRMITGAARGGTDATDRLTGGAYLQESNTDFVGASGYTGINFAGVGEIDFPTYDALSESGNSYGSGSARVDP